MKSDTQKYDAFEPQNIAFCCNYSACAAADLAGSARLKYEPNVKIIRLPCNGKIDVLHLLHAFEVGADGVYVANCCEGTCQVMMEGIVYTTPFSGCIHARKKVAYAKKLLEEIGLESERLEMYNMSAAMGSECAKVANEMTEKIKELGPNPVKVGRETR